jgi:transcription elongation GreA/GreB family factor
MTNYFTHQGFERYKAQIRKLEEDLQRLESNVGDVAETGGGWHDNAALDHLNYDIRVADSRLRDAYRLLNDYQIITYPASVDSVVIGCEVEITRDGKTAKYQIVGHGDADTADHRMLYESPLALALMGRKKGEAVTALIAGKNARIEIIDIRPIADKELVAANPQGI